MSEIEDFIQTIAALRHPETGCPWNREQTHGSLKRYLLEESYETLEAIDAVDASVRHPGLDPGSQSYADLKEELGDLLLQILLHARIAEEAGHFSINDVARACNDKMIRRHPHVFGSVTGVETAEEVDKHWDKAKAIEKSQRKSIFEGIPNEMPALARAWLISKKAVRESFEWDNEPQLWQQLDSEVAEFKEAISEPGFTKADAELELGDILFTVVNVARWNSIDPEDALRKTNNKFINRFNTMVEIAKVQGKTLKDYPSTELEKLWKEAKVLLRCQDIS